MSAPVAPEPARVQFPPLSPQAGANLSLSQPDSRGVLLPRQSRMGTPEMSHRVAILAPTYRHAQRQP
jgi:hypothetical protein